MKNSTLILIIALAMAAALLPANASAQQNESAEVLLGAALHQEEVEGNLEEAIKTYQKVLAEHPDNRSIAARALLQIGGCYEKLGKDEARKAYERLLRDYDDQFEQATLARSRLAALEDVIHKPIFRKIRIPTGLSVNARLSPDGQKVILAYDSELWIMPLSGKLGSEFPGAPVKLNTGDVKIDGQAGLAWSGDGKWIAFNGEEVKEGYQRIYVVSADGGKPRQVHENNRGARIVNYRISLSPHGKTLAFSSADEGKLHISTISIDGGIPKQLVDAQAREPVFSPDGKTIAYVEDKDLGRGGGGLWTVPADGGTPTLVAKAGYASSPVWSPDGRMIAFLDYEKGRHIYIIPIGKGGEHTGEMITVDAPEGIEEVRLLAGWPPDNKIGAITIGQQEFALYTLPEKGGKATIIAHGGYPAQPRWSPDGKRIFHTNKLDKGSGDWKGLAIASVSAEGGKVVTVPLQLEAKIRLWAYGAGNRISPDGNTVVFAGQTTPEGPHIAHIWTLPIDGGTPRQLTDSPSPFRDYYPCWSPDGRNIAFVRREAPENWTVPGKANIYIISADGGEPRQITSESDRVFDTGPVLWSPDGKLLAYFSRNKDDAADGTLKVIPPDGGKPRIVAKVERIFANKEFAWSPDSKRIAFNGSDNKNIKVVSINEGSLLDIKTGLTDPDIYNLDWSPDGNRFVFAGATGGNREFWLLDNFLPESTASE